MENRFNLAATRFDQWLTQSVYDKWCSEGFASNGAAIERFTADGVADWQADKRIRVQARQLFSMCYGYKQGFLPQGPTFVKGINKYIDSVCGDYLPGYYPMSIDANNQIKNNDSDLYDIAFFLLAYAWQFDALGDNSALDKARRLTDHFDKTLASEHGGWLEGTYAHDVRRQNPHMHLFEAFMQLYLFTQDPYWKQFADKIFALFENHFFDSEYGVIREYFTPSWKISPEKGDIIEPGHLMEWVWLLNRYEQISGQDMSTYCDALYAKAKEFGLPEGGKWLIDTVKPDGSSPANTSRCWPMTEWIKAALVMAERHPNSEDYGEDAILAINGLVDGFGHPARTNQYVDSIDTNGTILDPLMPASSLYHLSMAHYEVMRAVTKA
ncbi:AGE family epimerase/isomerase [Alteromonas sp. C1M14]|uniref:AGE family epimerase/isomerase n=1 Tax=Alteromonas sp. C1M14 TaxID=2841567 RepID=UPI001C08DA88|nr:AGE family epimerase/isomerase [Alteromonas sp. C1M14]MBU2977195.1 AGE family epimerase/isomerase [Alteromonas sp. C1M14]